MEIRSQWKAIRVISFGSWFSGLSNSNPFLKAFSTKFNISYVSFPALNSLGRSKDSCVEKIVRFINKHLYETFTRWRQGWWLVAQKIKRENSSTYPHSLLAMLSKPSCLTSGIFSLLLRLYIFFSSLFARIFLLSLKIVVDRSGIVLHRRV